MCLRSISGEKESGVALNALAPRLLPWNQTLSGLTQIRVGVGTKVRDHPKAVGLCASAVMVGISYRDTHWAPPIELFTQVKVMAHKVLYLRLLGVPTG